jgi:hypothetical protein
VVGQALDQHRPRPGDRALARGVPGQPQGVPGVGAAQLGAQVSAVAGDHLLHVTGLVDDGHDHPVGQRRHAQAGQPVEQVVGVEGGDERAGRLGHQRQAALGLLGSPLRPLGDRPGLLGLLPGGLLGGEGGLALGLPPHPLGDVGLHADGADQLAVAVEDRADRELVPERGAVAAVVEQRDGHRLAGAQRRPDRGDGGRVGARALQEPAVAAHRLLEGVPGDPAEGGVDPDQRVVRPAWVGDRERDVGGDDGPLAQRLQLGLRVAAAADPLDLEEDDQRQLLAGAGLGQREAGDPQQPVAGTTVVGGVCVGGVAGTAR